MGHVLILELPSDGSDPAQNHIHPKSKNNAGKTGVRSDESGIKLIHFCESMNNEDFSLFFPD